VPIPTSKILIVSSRLPKNRRYCREWVATFLTDFSQAYYAQFHKPLIVDSAVRSIDFQKRLERVNRNAAGISGDSASPHLTGIAVDINKRNFSKQQLDWTRRYLYNFEQDGKIDVEEEFRQKCFHISVFRDYDAVSDESASYLE